LIALATGLLVRDGRVLLVASRYPNHPEPLWNLPGGRQIPGELLTETVEREFLEETGLPVRVDELAYASESYDGETHFLNVTFVVMLRQAQHDSEFLSFDTGAARPAQDDTNGDHVVDVAWVPVEQVERRVAVRVVREPLLAYLRGELTRRYAGSHEAGVTIEWPPDSH
jgi:ADP-ribose pyrophosphatase YjhB (NUDIX family)